MVGLTKPSKIGREARDITSNPGTNPWFRLDSQAQTPSNLRTHAYADTHFKLAGLVEFIFWRPIRSLHFLSRTGSGFFQNSTRIQNNSLNMAGRSLASLADEYGTPLYLYDRATMDASVAAYKAALKTHYPGLI